MSRRRALMGITGELQPVYQLLDYSFSNGQIRTETSPFAADKDLTILLDITTTSNPTSGSGSQIKFIQAFNLTFSNSYPLLALGKQATGSTGLSCTWCSDPASYQTLTGSTAAAGRKRFAVLHRANSTTLTIMHKMGTGATYTQTLTAESFTAGGDYLDFGGSGNWSLSTGIINKAAIYNSILPESILNNFFA